MKVKMLKDVGNWKANEVYTVHPKDAAWLVPKGLAKAVAEESFDDLFAEAETSAEKPKPEPKPKVKIQPSNKANKAPENK